jgi:hypothetical protein
MLMIVLSLLHVPVLIVRFNQGFFHMLVFDVPLMLFATLSVVSFYATAILYRYPNEKWRLWMIPLAMSVGIGMVFSNTRAVLEALFGIQSSFVRTPKYKVVSQGDSWLQVARKYRRRKGWLPFLELSFAGYFVFAVYYAFRSEIYATIPFLMIFLVGYGYIGGMSLLQGQVERLLAGWRRH